MNTDRSPAPFEAVRKLVETVIVHSPFGRHLGVSSDEIAVDRVRLRLPFANDLVTLGDLVHGGAIASLCDVAATAACWANPSIEPGSRGTTISLSLSLSFLSGGRGQDLVAEARVVQRGRSVCVAEIEVRGADGTLVARATATYKLDAPRVAKAPADPLAVLAGLFEGRTPAEQRSLLARMERAGAEIYRGFAAGEDDADARRRLLEAAEREVANAVLLERGEGRS